MERLKSSNLYILIITVSLIVTAATFYVPVAAGVDNPLATHLRTAATTFISAVYVGSAWALLGGLKSFKRELRIAYRLMAFGILAFSAAFIQLVVWGLLDIWNSAWATSGSGLAPFLITSVLLYSGVRKFAKLVGVNSRFGSFLLVTGITVVVGAVFGVAASHLVQYKLDGVEIYIAVCAICMSYLFFAGVLMYRIYRTIGAYYKTAMGWLAASIFGFSIASLHEAVNTFWFNNGDTYTDYGYYLIPWIVVGFILVRASYEFRMLPALAGSTDSTGPVEQATNRDYIDSILNVVGLVSKPGEVEAALDELRFVTARLKPDADMPAADKQRLLAAYSQIETYLLTKDPLRAFTKEEIRSHATPAFQQELAKHTKVN